ncbi:MAG: hypothetical protein WKG00_39290 [Polyangiaceae bacterium]
MTLRFALPWLLVLLTTVAGCGSDEDDDPGTAASTGGPSQPDPPTWTDAPTGRLPIGQGQSLSLPLTLVYDGDVQSALVAAPPGIEAGVSPDASKLDIYATYNTVRLSTAVGVELPNPPGPNVTYAVSLDVRPIAWRPPCTCPTAAGPEAREHAAVVVDDPGRQVFMLGGSGYMPQFVPLADFWRYDLDTGDWTEVTPTGDVPQAAGSRRVAGSAEPGVSYMFGGYGEGNVNFDELYRVRVDGQSLTFTLLDQENGPSARSLHGFAYDAVADRYVMFGGASTKPLDDLWTMTIAGDVATWAEVAPAVAPSARYGFFYGVDEALGRLYLFSGAQGFAAVDPAPDTWMLDLRADPPAWTLLLEGDDVTPPGRRNGCTVFDPSGPRMFVFGGTPDGANSTPGLWVFDARPDHARWEQLVRDGEPHIRSSGFGFYDPTTGRSQMGFGNDAGIYRDWNIVGYAAP